MKIWQPFTGKVKRSTFKWGKRVLGLSALLITTIAVQNKTDIVSDAHNATFNGIGDASHNLAASGEEGITTASADAGSFLGAGVQNLTASLGNGFNNLMTRDSSEAPPPQAASTPVEQPARTTTLALPSTPSNAEITEYQEQLRQADKPYDYTNGAPVVYSIPDYVAPPANFSQRITATPNGASLSGFQVVSGPNLDAAKVIEAEIMLTNIHADVISKSVNGNEVFAVITQNKDDCIRNATQDGACFTANGLHIK